MLKLKRASEIPVVDFESVTDPCHGLSHAHFVDLPLARREELWRLIARVSEKSYRRGFQQGYDSHNRGDDLCDLLAWRFEIDLDYSVSPHGTYHSSSEERMELECRVGKVGLGGTTKLNAKTWGDIFFRLFGIRQKRKRTVSSKLRFQVLRRDRFKCVYCGITASASELHVDHVIPVVDGGSDEPANLVTSCIDCNLGKGTTRIS